MGLELIHKENNQSSSKLNTLHMYLRADGKDTSLISGSVSQGLTSGIDSKSCGRNWVRHGPSAVHNSTRREEVSYWSCAILSSLLQHGIYQSKLLYQSPRLSLRTMLCSNSIFGFGVPLLKHDLMQVRGQTGQSPKQEHRSHIQHANFDQDQIRGL